MITSRSQVCFAKMSGSGFQEGTLHGNCPKIFPTAGCSRHVLASKSGRPVLVCLYLTAKAFRQTFAPDDLIKHPISCGSEEGGTP